MDRKKISITLCVLALLAIGAWAMGYFDGVDPKVAELQQLRDENFERMEQMPDEERRAQWGEFRARVDELSDEQRREFFEGSRDFFQARMLDRMNHLLDLPPEEQKKELDEQIDRMEQRRKEREAGGEARGDRGGGGGPGGRGGGGGNGGKGRLDRSTPEMRAKMDRYRDLLNARREERGLPPIEGGGRGFGGGFR